jgi:DNA-binding transcriptional ArsR family regulator
MDYLRRVLHLNIKIIDSEPKYPLPNYIINRYTIRKALFDKQKVFLVYPKTELDKINIIKNHIQKIQSLEKIPTVLVLTRITARQRQNMVDAGIPFVVENKQCYLPFIGTIFTERCDVEVDLVEKLLPSAQMLLFYYILKKQKEICANEAVSALGVSAMTITRAVRQLEQTGLIHTHKNGVMKIISSEYDGKELFERAKKYLFCPIKQKMYIRKDDIDGKFLFSGDTALSMYSMLNPPRVDSYAIGISEKCNVKLDDTLIDDEQQAEIQIWKYNPSTLAKDSTVDVLSLAMCYIDDNDERIAEAVDEMLGQYWEKSRG